MIKQRFLTSNVQLTAEVNVEFVKLMSVSAACAHST